MLNSVPSAPGPFLCTAAAGGSHVGGLSERMSNGGFNTDTLLGDLPSNRINEEEGCTHHNEGPIGYKRCQQQSHARAKRNTAAVMKNVNEQRLRARTARTTAATAHGRYFRRCGRTPGVAPRARTHHLFVLQLFVLRCWRCASQNGRLRSSVNSRASEASPPETTGVIERHFPRKLEESELDRWAVYRRLEIHKHSQLRHNKGE